MPLSWEEMQIRATAFAHRWRDAGQESAQAQSFVSDFLHVFGVDYPERLGSFEYRVSLDEGSQGYIDYLWPGQIGIEMKSRGQSLNAAYAQLKNYQELRGERGGKTFRLGQRLAVTVADVSAARLEITLRPALDASSSVPRHASRRKGRGSPRSGGGRRR